MAQGHLSVSLRPLSIMALEDTLPVNVSHEAPDVALMLLSELTNERPEPLTGLRVRYKQVTDEEREPIIIPDHQSLMRHVVRPLREAKQCYVLGMPVACIAQAGLVGEMVALWRFRMVEAERDGQPMNDLQDLLQGRAFASLGQKERVRVLRAVEQLDEDIVSAFGELRGLRRRYLHYMVEAHVDIESDARRALGYANRLVLRTLGITYGPGSIILPPRVLRYVRDIVALDGADAQVSSTCVPVPASTAKSEVSTPRLQHARFWLGLVLYWLGTMMGAAAIERLGLPVGAEQVWITAAMITAVCASVGTHLGSWSGRQKVGLIILAWLGQGVVAGGVLIWLALSGETARHAARLLSFLGTVPFVVIAMRRSSLFAQRVR